MLKTCFIICGPTAVGKTGLSLQLASALKTSIISADSRQCYRELNIGVAKPDAIDLLSTPHYFINSHSIFDEVNAAGFAVYAEAAAAEILSASDSLIMVGGTGLYINAFCDGLDLIPPVDPLIRNQIRDEYAAKGIQWLRFSLEKQDPLFAETGEMSNPQRMMRALEVIQSSGASIRTYQRAPSKKPPFRIIKIGLDMPREALYQRINERVDAMMAMGLLREVEGLLAYKHLNALNTVGYKELIAFLDGNTSLGEAIALIKQNTRRYAKRQLTWFKKDKEISWFPADEFEAVINYCVQEMNKEK